MSFGDLTPYLLLSHKLRGLGGGGGSRDYLMYIEDQAFSPSLAPLSRQQVFSLFQSFCTSPIELTDGKEG
jgi:hypothetical protein